jgi:hypothetical protein
LLSPKSRADFDEATEAAFRKCQQHQVIEGCLDLSKADRQGLPGMYLRGETQSGECFVQSWRDIEHRTPNGLRLSLAQGRYIARYDGRPLDWRSPEAKAAYTAMRCVLAGGLQGHRYGGIAIPLPKPK